MTNARAETLAEKPAFRTAYKKRRCVVPTDGFYEWQKPDTPKGAKQPYYIHWAGDEPRVFAGLWEPWNDPDGMELLTFTIITTAANDVMKPVHDSIPVILSQDEAELWLDADASPDDVAALLHPCPVNWLALSPVGMAVNSPRNDSPGCIEPTDC